MDTFESTAVAPRRAFLLGMARTAATLAIAGCRSAAATVPDIGAGRAAPSSKWDDSWTKRLGAHRTVFDFAEIEATPGMGQIPPVMDAYNEVLGTTDHDLGFVLVVRHMAVTALLDDAMWNKYDLGADLKHKDPSTSAPFKRNPFRGLISLIQNRGVVLLGCNTALMGLGAMMAQREKKEMATVQEEFRKALFPGVILLPNGLYALSRAQEVGCGFMR
ncbi:MAG: hypothetical protein ABIY52_06205 [Gemmatimonadaceae bacterium]